MQSVDNKECTKYIKEKDIKLYKCIKKSVLFG